MTLKGDLSDVFLGDLCVEQGVPLRVVDKFGVGYCCLDCASHLILGCEYRASVEEHNEVLFNYYCTYRGDDSQLELF